MTFVMDLSGAVVPSPNLTVDVIARTVEIARGVDGTHGSSGVCISIPVVVSAAVVRHEPETWVGMLYRWYYPGPADHLSYNPSTRGCRRW